MSDVDVVCCSKTIQEISVKWQLVRIRPLRLCKLRLPSARYILQSINTRRSFSGALKAKGRAWTGAKFPKCAAVRRSSCRFYGRCRPCCSDCTSPRKRTPRTRPFRALRSNVSTTLQRKLQSRSRRSCSETDRWHHLLPTCRRPSRASDAPRCCVRSLETGLRSPMREHDAPFRLSRSCCCESVCLRDWRRALCAAAEHRSPTFPTTNATLRNRNRHPRSCKIRNSLVLSWDANYKIEDETLHTAVTKYTHLSPQTFVWQTLLSVGAQSKGFSSSRCTVTEPNPSALLKTMKSMFTVRQEK